MKAELESTPEPLDAWHRRHGACWREGGGRPMVASYGDVAAELEALRTGYGLIEVRWAEGLVVSGEDRARFVNGYVTCDVGALEPGEGAYGFFTSAQGRILADTIVTVDDESLRLDLPAGRGRVIAEHLSRYILADRVEVREEGGVVRWALVGPGVDDVVGHVGEIPAADWQTAAGDVEGRPVAVRRERPLGVPVFGLRAADAEAPLVADRLVGFGAVPVGLEAVETLRVEAGVPWYGIDFDEAHFPQETGLADAVSYTKGCYLGQEVVARIHYRGRVNHELRSLRVEGEVELEPGPVALDGQEVGKLGSVAFSPILGETLALAVLHRKAEVGSDVSLPGGVVARVAEAGFAAAAMADPTDPTRGA